MNTQSQVIREYKCTQANAAQFRAIVKATPALDHIVTNLQQAGLFPGLRCMTITITAAPDLANQGPSAWHTIAASSRALHP